MENHSAVNLLQFRAEEPWINWVSYLQRGLFLVMALFSSLPSAACLKIKKKGMHLLSHSDWGTIVLHFFPLQPYLSHSNSASTATYESVLLTVGKNTFVQFLFRAAHNEKHKAFFFFFPFFSGNRAKLTGAAAHILAKRVPKSQRLTVMYLSLQKPAPATALSCNAAVTSVMSFWLSRASLNNLPADGGGAVKTHWR